MVLTQHLMASQIGICPLKVTFVKCNNSFELRSLETPDSTLKLAVQLPIDQSSSIGFVRQDTLIGF